MAAIFRLAWRNLGRNRRRTIITGVALAVGVSLSVAGYGLTEGMTAELLRALTRYDLGHVQVHHPDYPRARDLDDAVAGSEEIMVAALALDNVRGASPRVYAYALLGHANKSLGVELVGVDPRREIEVTTLHEQLVAGSYLDLEPTPWSRGRELTAAERASDEALTRAAEDEALAEIDALDGGDEEGEAAAGAPGANSDDDLTRTLAATISPPPERAPRVFIGVTVARILGVEVGDTIHATGQTQDALTEEVFLEVAGIYRTGTAMFDRARIYFHIADLQRFIHLYDQVHEIAIVASSPALADGLAAKLRKQLDGQPVLVRSWSEIRPDIKQMITMTDMSMAVMIFIIFFVATLGVVNTMLMAVFERTRELGMLKAIGMSGRRIVSLIIVETLLMVLVASLIGTLLGFALDLYMVYNGVDLSAITGGFSVGGVGINPVFHGAITVQGLVMPTLILSTTCFIASFYPALRAARLTPAVGMRET